MFVSQEFSVHWNRFKGYCLYSVTDLMPGDIVLIETPAFITLADNCFTSLCHSCFRNIPDLLRCSQCKYCRYCSVSCQKAHWFIHKRECKILLSFLPNIPTSDMMLLARMYLMLRDSLSLNYKKISPERGNFIDNEKKKQCNSIEYPVLRKPILPDDVFLLSDHLKDFQLLLSQGHRMISSWVLKMLNIPFETPGLFFVGLDALSEVTLLLAKANNNKFHVYNELV
jgi:hypothetical protein